MVKEKAHDLLDNKDLKISGKPRNKVLASEADLNNSSRASDSRPSKEDIAAASKWEVDIDKDTDKFYYYHRGTCEVQWDKPLGFDEAHNLQMLLDCSKTTGQMIGAIRHWMINTLNRRRRATQRRPFTAARGCPSI